MNYQHMNQTELIDGQKQPLVLMTETNHNALSGDIHDLEIQRSESSFRNDDVQLASYNDSRPKLNNGLKWIFFTR